MSSISNTTIHFDKLNQVEIPNVMICHKSKHRIGYLNCVENLKIKYFLNDMSTCDFKIPRMINSKKNRYYDYVDTKMNILVVGYGWFTITECITTSTGNSEYKTVSAKGLEYELTAQQVHDLEINSGDIDYDNYTPIKFYNPNNKDASLLHIVLDELPNWSIGHVDIELEDMQRSFDIDEQNVYAFLTGEVSEAFECFFIFDGYYRTVNAFRTENYGKNTRIMLNFNNLCQEIEVNYDDSSIITEYRIVGEDGIDIRNVNPTGSNVISNYSYFLNTKFMSQETIDCYNNFQQVYSENIDKYKDLLLKAKEVLDVIAELQQRLPDNLESTDWTKYGLVMLQTKQKMLNNTLNDFIAEGWGYATSEFYTQKYLPTYELLMSLEAEMKVRENEISFQQLSYKSYQDQISEIQELLNERNYYTEKAWLEKCSFGFKQTYTNDNFITTELDTDAEIMTTEQALYDVASKELADVCKPNMSFSATIDNIFHVQGFSKLFEEFELGNYIYVEINENYFIKVRLISYSIDFDDLSKSECKFSDLIDVSGKMSSLEDIISQVSSTSSSVTSSKKKWDYAVNEATTIYKIRKECLDLALYTITNADNQEFTIDNRGITGKHYNDEALDYDDEQVRITHNLMAYTDDNWKSVRSAFGKIWVNGEWQYGLIADALVSKIVMSHYLWIENESGNYRFDDNGFWGTNGTNTFILNPSNDEIFQILKGNEKVIWMDTNGNANFTGILTISNGTNTFIVNPTQDEIFQILKGDEKVIWMDTNGNANFTGTITGSTIIGSTIIGGTYLNENDTFKVTPEGDIWSYKLGDKSKYVHIGNGEQYMTGDFSTEGNMYLRKNKAKMIGVATDNTEIPMIRISGNNNLVVGGYADKSKQDFNINLYADEIGLNGTLRSASLKNANALRGYDTSNKPHDLIKFSELDNIVVGELSNPTDVNIYGYRIHIGNGNNQEIPNKPLFDVYSSTTSIICDDDLKLQAKSGTMYISGGGSGVNLVGSISFDTRPKYNNSGLVTKEEMQQQLDLLETEYLSEINYWKGQAEFWKSQYNSEHADAVRWRNHTCPPCTRPHADE